MISLQSSYHVHPSVSFADDFFVTLATTGAFVRVQFIPSSNSSNQFSLQSPDIEQCCVCFFVSGTTTLLKCFNKLFCGGIGVGQEFSFAKKPICDISKLESPRLGATKEK